MAKDTKENKASERRQYFRPEGEVLATFELILTVVFWGFWAYLIAPLLSLILWFAGIFLFYDRMIAMGGYEIFKRDITNYSLVVVVMMVCLAAWIYWNQWRYGRYNRRNEIPKHINSVQTGVYTGLNQESIEMMKGSRKITMHFDDQSQPVIENAEGLELKETRKD